MRKPVWSNVVVYNITNWKTGKVRSFGNFIAAYFAVQYQNKKKLQMYPLRDAAHGREQTNEAFVFVVWGKQPVKYSMSMSYFKYEPCPYYLKELPRTVDALRTRVIEKEIKFLQDELAVIKGE